MLRASLTVGIVVGLLALAFAASAGSSSGGTPVSSDPATSMYVEQVPAAGGTAGVSSNSPSGAPNLKQLLTSPTFGAPQRIHPLPSGSPGSTYGTFSFQTLREVAGVGTARLAGLLVLLVLISVALAAAAFRRFVPR